MNLSEVESVIYESVWLRNVHVTRRYRVCNSVVPVFHLPGNMNPYVTSYLRVVLNDTSMEYSKTTWVKSFSAIGQAVAMPLSGYLEQRLGVRLAVLIGCFTFSSSVLASGFSLQYSFTAFLFTYGFLFGIGIGITYPLCIACSIRWFPRRKGTISGVTMIGFGLSSVAFGIVETLLVNPSNLSPSTQGAGDVAHQKYVHCFA